MTRGRSIRLGVALALAAILALALRDVVERTIIGPAAYAWWIVGLLWRSVPQLLFWAIAAVAMLILVLDSLLPGRRASPRRPVRLPPNAAQGPVEMAAEWMRRASKGTYLKWRIANRLGLLAKEVLAQRDGRDKMRESGRLVGRDWAPPKEISEFLEAGLEAPFARHVSRRRPWSRGTVTALDADPEAAIHYLESQMGDEA